MAKCRKRQRRNWKGIWKASSQPQAAGNSIALKSLKSYLHCPYIGLKVVTVLILVSGLQFSFFEGGMFLIDAYRGLISETIAVLDWGIIKQDLGA